MVFLVQQEDPLIRKWHSDGKCLIFRELPVHNIVVTVAGDLSWSIEIHIQHIRQILPPVIELLHRHHLTTEHDSAKSGRYLIPEALQHGNDAKCRYSPGQACHLSVIQKIQKLLRNTEVFLRNHFQSRSHLQTWINILHRYIKIKGSLIADHILSGKSKDPCEMLRKIDNGTVGYHHTFWHSCGTGGEDRIEWIYITGHLSTAGKCLFINGRLCQFFCQQHFTSESKGSNSL